MRPRDRGESYLDETNVGGLLAEALTADVEAVLADQTSGVGADAAVRIMSASVLPSESMRALRLVLLHIAACRATAMQRQHPRPLPQTCIVANVPLAGALAVSPRAGVPDRLVRHDVWLIGVFGVAAASKSVLTLCKCSSRLGGCTDKSWLSETG